MLVDCAYTAFHDKFYKSVGNYLYLLTVSFELYIVKVLNKAFNDTPCTGLAYRLKQARFTSQKCDVIVDSPKHYWAIQCKTTKYGLFFSSNFSEGQVTQMSNFLKLTGRKGYLFVKYNKLVSVIPWRIVDDIFTKGGKGIPLAVQEQYAVDFTIANWLDIVSSRN